MKPRYVPVALAATELTDINTIKKILEIWQTQPDPFLVATLYTNFTSAAVSVIQRRKSEKKKKFFN